MIPDLEEAKLNRKRAREDVVLTVCSEDTEKMSAVDALVKAGKDFDLLVIPGARHGMGGAYGQHRLQDFFVRNLLGTEPPNRNAADKS